MGSASDEEQDNSDSNSEKSEDEVSLQYQNEEIKQELNDLRDSDGEEIYENINKNVRRPNEEIEEAEDGENIEDNID